MNNTRDRLVFKTAAKRLAFAALVGASFALGGCGGGGGLDFIASSSSGSATLTASRGDRLVAETGHPLPGNLWLGKAREPRDDYDTYPGHKPWVIFVVTDQDPGFAEGSTAEMPVGTRVYAYWCDGPGQQAYPARYRRDYAQPGGPWVASHLPGNGMTWTVLDFNSGRLTLTARW